MARGNTIQFSGTIDKVARNQGSFLIIDNGDELWFSVGYNPGGLNGAQVGDEVEFEYEEKHVGGKTFNNVKSEVTIVGEGAGDRPAPRQQAPRGGGRAAPQRQAAGGRQAPAQGRQQASSGGDDPRQRSIVRQNSLTQANALLATLERTGNFGELFAGTELEVAEATIAVARVFEAYSMGEV